MSGRFGIIFAVALKFVEVDGSRAFLLKVLTFKSLHVANIRPEDGIKKLISNVEMFNQ
jgi:hypothetical protein